MVKDNLIGVAVCPRCRVSLRWNEVVSSCPHRESLKLLFFAKRKSKSPRETSLNIADSKLWVPLEGR
jgi:hypothetical protein